MQVLCMHTVATPTNATMHTHWCCTTVVDHNLFWLACLVTFSLNASRMYTLDSVIFWNTKAKKNMWFVVKILTLTSARWQTSFILDLTWHTDSCTSLLQRPPRSVDVASCTDPGQLKILHRSRASSSPCYHRLSPISPNHFFMPANCYATNAMTSNNKSDQFAGWATIEIYQLAMT